MQKYCSEECQAEAKRLRKKRQQDLINGIEPIMDLQHQEYLTFSKAAILMGCTRQYIYKLVANGKLKASRLSSRMAFVRKADIEKMFEGNPYKRVVPASKSKLCKKAKTEKPTQNQEPTKGKEENEVLDYYSGEEVMSIYKVKKSWLYTSAKRNQIPMCRIAGKNYYSKRHIDEFFGTAVDLNSITEWVTADDVGDAFSMSKSALRAYTYRHKIPTKREYGRTYYSKEHLEELRRTDLMNDDNYYTTEQVQQLYGLTSAYICHIVRVHHISKVKVGVKNLLLKLDVERTMAERAAKEKARQEAEAKRESMARQNRYIGVLDKFIKEGHEALSSFAKTDRVNFNEKESASIYYSIMASAVKHNIGLDSKACIESAAKRFLSDMSWKGFTDFKQECVTSWTKLFATNEVQFTDNAIDTFLTFVDHMSCSADTYVSLGGSNGCADQLTYWDGTQKVGLGRVPQKKGKSMSC